MFCMLYTNELADSLLADLQCRPPVNVFISHTCTTSPFCTVKLNNNNNNNNCLYHGTVSDGSRQKHNTTVVPQDKSHLLVSLYWRALTFIFSFLFLFHHLFSSSPCSFPMGKRRNTCTGRGNKQKK